MKQKISEKFDYVNRIKDAILGIKQNELKEAYRLLNDSDYWVGIAAGRSKCTFNIAVSEIAKNEDKIIQTLDDIGFPGTTLYDAAPKIEKRYKKPLAIVVSGSGETIDVCNNLKKLSSYLNDKKNDNWKMLLVTSSPNSSAGKIVKEHNGTILEIRENNSESGKLRETAIMRDKFEIENLFVWQSFAQMMNEKSEPEKFYKIAEEKLPIIGEKIDDYFSSEECESLINNLARKSDVYCGGRMGGYHVSETLTIRLSHVKQSIGDQAFLITGPNTPKPRIGDPVIFTSCSGGKDIYPGSTEESISYVVNWSNEYKRLGANIYSFVGTKNSLLEKNSKYTTLIENETIPGKPNWFYAKATFIQSPIPVVLCEKLIEKGYPLRPDLLEWYHSI